MKTFSEFLQDTCQTCIPGYGSARMALCDFRELGIKYTINGEELQLECAFFFGYITFKSADGSRAWIKGEDLESWMQGAIRETMRDLNVAFDKTGQWLRAVNPFWFFGEDANKNLDTILAESVEEYLEKVKK